MEPRFQDQVVIVTGASKGIGQATACAFAREGARVIVNYRSDDAGAQETLAQIEQGGGQAWLYRVDISQVGEAEKMVSEIEQQVGPIRVLVNNAAAFNRQPFLEVPLDELDRVWATNVRGLYSLSQQVARRMAARGQGAIVHISSILAQLTVPGRTVYCTTKGAVESLAKAMAIDLKPYNVRVNVISPGMIRTEALLSGFSPELQAAVQSYIPGGRFGEGEEVAQAILFLSSDAASYITGVVLPVDSGLSSREAGPPAKPVQN